MVQVIPANIKDVWDAGSIRGMILLSLSIQTVLIIFAPLRKRTPNRFLSLVLWLSYLLADWSANFVIGLIAKNQGKESKPGDPPQDKKLMALWAPFLLLHLGGPDTITAYSLEDNALWHRHFLGLALQAITGAYVVIQSLPNPLSVIILLLFIAGTFKYLERTIALYLASSDKFRGSMLKVPDSQSNDTQQTDNSRKNSETYEYARQKRPLRLNKPIRALKHIDILQFAFWFFNNFKSLVVNNIFSFEQRDESVEFFKSLKKSEEALRILEVELGFIYEGLYTKVSVLHTWVGAVTRTIALGTLLSAFYIFHDKPKKSNEFHGTDIVITYTLFLVGIALDLASLLMALPSDWTFAVFSRLNEDEADSGSRIDPALDRILGLKKLHWKKRKCCKGTIELKVLDTPLLFKRWAGRIKMFNFIAYSIKADPEKIFDTTGTAMADIERIPNTNGRTVADKERIDDPNSRTCRHVWKELDALINIFKKPCKRIASLLGVSNLLDDITLEISVYSEPLTEELWEFIFKQLKSRLDRPPKERSKAKAGWKGWTSGNTELEMANLERLMPYISDVDYDQSLMVWHIATELCYREEESPEEPSTEETRNHPVFSKIISDYMMYLLIMQPKLMSEVAGIGKIRFRDTLAEAERFYKRRRIENSRDVEKASSEILKVRTEIDPKDVKGNQSKTVLFEARALAKELNKLKDRDANKWTVMSQVWMELLSYAASNSDASARMEQLSKGGEFLNFVWLAMAHLGLGDESIALVNEAELGRR